jgi:DNA polymerase II small subunit
MIKQEAIKELLKKGIIPTTDNLNNLKKDATTNVEILKNFKYEPHKIKVREFMETNRAKYSIMRNLLMNRSELNGAVSISRISQMNEKKVTIIGMVFEIKKLPTGTYRLVVEDLSGRITAIVSKNDPELIKKISFVTHDEVIGLIGSYVRDVFFIKDIVWPGVPQKQIPTYSDDIYVAFLADIHLGSNVFLEKEFEKAIDWIAGKHGNEKQKEIASKIKYILIIGDIVDGVGVYPHQDNELNIKDIYEQYEALGKYLAQIPKDKHIIISAGTHDGVRIEDPKPKLPENLAKPLHDLSNVIFVTNPALINLHRTKDYPGISVMMYHGDSFDYYVNNVEGLRLLGGYDKPDEIHKYLLKRRSLSPDYKGLEQLPIKENPLIFQTVPDVLATGHIHKLAIGNYHGVITIAASCFQARTSYQEKLGHHPDPGKVVLLNLKNLKATVMDFLEK